MKKGIALAMALCMTLSVNASVFTSSVKEVKASAPAGKDYSKEIRIKFYQRTDTSPPVEQPLFDQVRKEKFNLVYDVTKINTADWTTKMNLMFASGEQVDYLSAMRPNWGMNDWSDNGYLRGFTKDEIKKLMPNEIMLWNDEKTFDYVYSLLVRPDGKLYHLPGARSSAGNMAWTYREDTFNSLGLKMPKNPEEFLAAFEKIKTSTGRIPYISQSSGGGAPIFAFSGFLLMYGLPELLASNDYYYYQPVTKQFVPYGAVTDEYREFVKFVNKMYKSGYTWEEFATATVDQANKMKTQGNGYMLWGYVDQLTSYDNFSKQTDKDAKWTWSDTFPTADAKKGTFVKRDPYHLADLFGFGATIKPEALSRIMDYLNWALTEEGMMWGSFGKEGVTYKMVNGKPQFLERFKTPLTEKGDSLDLFQIGATLNGFLRVHPLINELYKPNLKLLEDKVIKNKDYSYFMTPVLNMKNDEIPDISEIVTNLGKTRDTYTAKFMLGQGMDPSNDADWKKYIDDMKKIGVDKLSKSLVTIYERSNKK